MRKIKTLRRRDHKRTGIKKRFSFKLSSIQIAINKRITGIPMFNSFSPRNYAKLLFCKANMNTGLVLKSDHQNIMGF